MCFRIHEDSPSQQIAKTDIICYKRLRKGKKYFTSPCQGFKYEKGECYYEDNMTICEDFCGNKIIEQGLHSYSCPRQAKHMRYSFGTESEKIVKCVIPEGAIYYYNPRREEYVSEYLIIGTDKDIIPLKDIV